MESATQNCPHCGSSELYRTRGSVSAAGSYGPNLLPGLNSFFKSPRIAIVVCAACGLIRMFAGEEERKRLADAHEWEQI